MRLHGIKLGILDEVNDLNRQAGSELVIQKEMAAAFNKLTKSIDLNNQALKKAEQGLKASKELGEPKSIETFSRIVAIITKQIALTNKTLDQVKSVNIGF